MLLAKLEQLGSEFDRRHPAPSDSNAITDDAIATLHGAELPPLDWSEIIDYAFHAGNRSDFANLNIVAHAGRHTRVELLIWGAGTPDIHSHAFTGAFRVLEGGSVHACYSVTQESWRSPTVVVGDVRLDRIEILRPGDTRSIRPGLGFLHGLFHHGMPSATVVLRTHGDPANPIQYGMPPPLRETTAVLTAGAEINRDPKLRAIGELAQLLPPERFEHEFAARAQTLSSSHLWYLRHVFSERLGEDACARLDAVLPAPLRRPMGVRRGLPRHERARLRSDEARMTAGIVLYAPDADVATTTLARAFPGMDPWARFADGAGRMFADILREDDDEGISGIVVDAVLRGCDARWVLTTLGERYDAASVAAHASEVEIAHAFVRAELGRFADARFVRATSPAPTQPRGSNPGNRS